MAGDHRCSVCQATFTRPQHVARHMRSHTGDRPYKCLHCGDQFARSDLLSRHVNKCHANENPIQPTGNSRRKGSASASRATTSKQACDQCVQSCLPCDGSNPCAKCVQRKGRCTFVKFHRQTAPIGPGHCPRLPTTISNYKQPEDFLLAPAPANAQHISDNLYSSSFAFPTLYSYNTDPATSLSLRDNSDFATNYCTQTDALTRAGTTGLSHIPHTISNNPDQSLYSDPTTATPWVGWSQDHDHQSSSGAQEDRYLPPLDNLKQQPPVDLQTAYPNPLPANPQSPGFASSRGLEYTQSAAYSRDAADRRASAEFGSDSGSAPHSLPSSSSSSSVHLPLDFSIHSRQQMPYRHEHNVSARDNDFMSLSNEHVPSLQLQHQRPSHAEGGVSSAFGLMSLDDPNVLAGLSADGPPFFSNAAMDMSPQDPNVTPMPPNHNNPQGRSRAGSSSREAETRELREFWKQYMRTPLSGPMRSPFSRPESEQPHAATPSNHRRVRVASFPSSSTPSTIGDKDRSQLGAGADNNSTPAVCMTLHGSKEDLRAYEAAVLARKTPTQLHIVPRARRNMIGGASPSPQGATVPVSGALINGSNNEYLKINGHANVNTNAGSRPGSSASMSSSLANVFGKQDRHDRMDTSRQGNHSRGPSLDDTGSDRDGLRPSFKRLPSQTLGPAYAKRPLLSHRDDGNEWSRTGKAAVGSDRNIPVGGDSGNTGKTINGVIQPAFVPSGGKHG